MKLNTLFILGIALALSSCSSSKQSTASSEPILLNENTFLISQVSSDESYGYTEANPIKVGGVKNSEGPINERRFINALAGPNKEKISYERTGSCCPFESKNGFNGKGLLDRYKLTWAGQAEPIYIYINMYDYGELKVPTGLTLKN